MERTEQEEQIKVFTGRIRMRGLRERCTNNQPSKGRAERRPWHPSLWLHFLEKWNGRDHRHPRSLCGDLNSVCGACPRGRHPKMPVFQERSIFIYIITLGLR